MSLESPLQRIANMKPIKKASEPVAERSEEDEGEREAWGASRRERYGKNLSKALGIIRRTEAVLQLAEKIHGTMPDSALNQYLQGGLQGIMNNALFIEGIEEELRTKGINADYKNWMGDKIQKARDVRESMPNQLVNILTGLSNIDGCIAQSVFYVKQAEENVERLKRGDHVDPTTVEDASRHLEFLRAVKSDLDAMGGWNAIVDLVPSELWALKKRDSK